MNSEAEYGIADRNYPIHRKDMVDGMPMLEIVCLRFFDGLPTVNCSVVRHKLVQGPAERCYQPFRSIRLMYDKSKGVNSASATPGWSLF